MITASFTFCGTEFKDVEVVNPGGWFGKTWLMEIGGSYAPFFVVVEAEHLSDAIDELIDSKYGHQFIIPESDYSDYDIDTDNPSCSFAGNNGHPVDLEHLMFHGDDHIGFPCLYHVEGWGVVKPEDLDGVLSRIDERNQYIADVTKPGRFLGQAPCAPYYWDSYLAGDELLDDDGSLRFVVTEEDRLMFPELREVQSVRLVVTEEVISVEVE